jgi:hypothetical protein
LKQYYSTERGEYNKENHYKTIDLSQLDRKPKSFLLLKDYDKLEHTHNSQGSNQNNNNNNNNNNSSHLNTHNIMGSHTSSDSSYPFFNQQNVDSLKRQNTDTSLHKNRFKIEKIKEGVPV